MREEVLRLSEVTCVEQGVVQLEDFCLNVFAGEIVGLLHRSGHGVSALLDLLRFNLPLRAGSVYYREQLVNSWRAPGRHENRIAVIQNKSSLVGDLTVADNIFVLRPGFRSWLVRPQVLAGQVQPVLDSIGVNVRADALVSSLSPFERVAVELVKAVLMGSKLIVLREIGTIISDEELERLHTLVRRYADEGFAFLYISYHYEELMQICDRTAVYSNGRIIKVLTLKDGDALYNGDYLARVQEQRRQSPDARRGPCALELRELRGGDMRGLSLTAAQGECVVVQDMQNLVFDDLIAVLTGEREADSGDILLGGKPFTPHPTRELAIIRELPDVSMIFPEMSCLDNLCMTVDHRLPEIWRNRRVREGLRKEWSQRLGEDAFTLYPDRMSRRQRYDVVYQRVLLQKPRVVVCVQPFRGAYLDTRMHILELLEELLQSGAAVVILAVNLADTFTLADRLVRVQRGATCEVYERSEFDRLPFCAPWLNLYKTQ